MDPLGRRDEWNRVTRVAERQHGVIGLTDLHRCAADRSHRERPARRWVRTGRLELVAPGTWRIVGSPVTWRQQLWIGLVALGSEACVSHEAAAALHGFDRSRNGAIEFTVPRSMRSRRVPGAVVHSSVLVPRRDRVFLERMPVTSAGRTIEDLANAGVALPRLEAAIDSAVRTGLASPVAIRIRLDSRDRLGRHGTMLVARVLRHAGVHTMLERRFLELVERAGLPRPELQVVLTAGIRHLARVDFLFVEAGIVVEVSGQLGHSSPTERAKDAHRRNELVDLGLLVYEYTWEDVTGRPDNVVRSLRTRYEAAVTGSAQPGPDL